MTRSQSPSFHADNLASPRLSHAFFTRGWGNAGFSGQKLQVTCETRAGLAAQLRVEPAHLLCCHQIHSPDVVTVTGIWSAEANPRADAMVTDKVGIALGILTADCVPILFADPEAGVIGAAHAGWRGAVGGVIENSLAAMEALGARRRDIRAALGPCIWQDSYEVGPEFPVPILAEDLAYEQFFRAGSEGHFYFDLPGYVVERLRRDGVGSVAGSMADTCGDPERFFSHRYSTLRREQRAGNLMSAIALVG